MKYKALAAVALAAVGSLLAAACGSSSGDSDGKAGLTFSTYAWQTETVKATKNIVAAWNKSHPDTPVKMVPVDADSVHDKLVTQFGGGEAPDIIHDESADLGGFAQQGYLADLGPLLSDDVKSQVSKDVWGSVTYDGKVVGMPTLLQSYNVFVNTDLLKQAGITPPTTDNPWTWDDFQAAARKLTKGKTYGVGWGLKSPVAAVMSLSMNFDGKYFDGAGKDAKLTFGPNEQQVLSRIHGMIYDDKSIAKESTSLSAGDILPGFYGGKYAMIVAGNYNVQQILEQAPKDFNWQLLPALKGTSVTQAANPQTLSVAAQSEHQKEAAEFVAYYANAQNLAKLAQGDWLIPATTGASEQVLKDTKGEDGWDTMVAAGKTLAVAPFQKVDNYPQWKDQIATPGFQQYFADKVSIDELGKQLESGWQSVAGR
ncbi:ABC transporter substrate-binding protein [Flindersiella endophytica]